ncbi:MAG: hypothetical protein IPM24_01810 [Bryobacterales bacterium]|jgi:hypothetical protein|nr:hypothetical protein [Bryobacterales bacterium]
MLHIIGGDPAAIQSVFPGETVRWLDPLHEGPVPAGLALEALTAVRTPFLAAAGLQRNGDLTARDAALARYREHQAIVLWFERDLHDQLQLIQALDWLLTRDRSAAEVSAVPLDQLPGVARRKVLGQLSPEQLEALYLQRKPVPLADLRYAAEVWQAFAAPSPVHLVSLASRSADAAVAKGVPLRLLEQYPAVSNGLSRTERHILEAAASGAGRVEELFLAAQDREERVFLSEAAFRYHLERLEDVLTPLLLVENGLAAVTVAGMHVLQGKLDAIALNGIDRWIGGVHLCGSEPVWRWDETNRKLVERGSGARRH